MGNVAAARRFRLATATSDNVACSRLDSYEVDDDAGHLRSDYGPERHDSHGSWRLQ